LSRRHIVMISQIPLWSMGKQTGGPAFRETLSHLGEACDVTLITPELEYVEQHALPQGVTLRPFRHSLHGLFRSVRKLGWLTDTLGWYQLRRAAWRVAREVAAQGQIDLVYGYEIYGVPVGRRLADLVNAPFVARYQGTLMSYRMHERLAGLRYLKHLSALRTPADLYVMTDDGTLGDVVLRDLGHPAERVLFLMNGVDPSIVDLPRPDVRPQLGIAPEVPLLMTVSRLMNWKRVDRAIETLARLRDSGHAAELVVVGVGPLEGSLRELASSRGVAEVTHFVGGVARDNLAGFYHSADAVLSLYDYSNLANPVIEAMLLGTPVFALGVGGTDHLVHDGVNGVLLGSETPADIAASITRYLDDPERLHDLGARGAAWAAENLWSWDARMRVELDQLERLMQQGGRA
jgi:glycosyltransferase involved in cell wall biosynthesis